MTNTKFNIRDITFHAYNEQEYARGTSYERLEDNTVFFIIGVEGASNSNPVTIKDENDTIVTVVAQDKEYFFPLRIENGFKVTSSNNSVIRFFRMRRISAA